MAWRFHVIYEAGADRCPDSWQVEEIPASPRARLPKQRAAVDEMFPAERLAGLHARFQNVQTHHISYVIVQRERKEIGVDDGVQANGELMEQRLNIAMPRDDF